MGVKSIKEKYKIEHIVHKKNDNIAISSGYISEIIVISPEGKIIKGADKVHSWNFSNGNLARYVREMKIDEDSGELKRLFHETDTYTNMLPVYTTRSGKVIKKYCEEYGWPNTTIDGELMYENTFFKEYKKAIKYLNRDTQLGVKYSFERLCNNWIDFYKSLKRFFSEVGKYIFARTINRIVKK